MIFQNVIFAASTLWQKVDLSLTFGLPCIIRIVLGPPLIAILYLPHLLYYNILLSSHLLYFLWNQSITPNPDWPYYWHNLLIIYRRRLQNKYHIKIIRNVDIPENFYTNYNLNICCHNNFKTFSLTNGLNSSSTTINNIVRPGFHLLFNVKTE